LRVVLQPANRTSEGAEDFLAQVGGVGVLQSLLARVVVDQRAIQRDELRPGGHIVWIAQADEQARTGGRNLGHWSSNHAASTQYPDAPKNDRAAATFFQGTTAALIIPARNPVATDQSAPYVDAGPQVCPGIFSCEWGDSPMRSVRVSLLVLG